MMKCFASNIDNKEYLWA